MVTSEWCCALEPPMACRADTRCILVRAECPYVQCSLLLVLPCTGVLVVGGYKLVEKGMAPRSLWVGAVVCLSVCLVCCHYWALSIQFDLSLSRVPPSPFIVCKGRGRVTVFACMKIERKGPKVLPIASFPLSSCIHIVIVVAAACRGCRWRGEAIPWHGVMMKKILWPWSYADEKVGA
jgi:hypothetical protein